jgi:hypothetical protein
MRHGSEGTNIRGNSWNSEDDERETVTEDHFLYFLFLLFEIK